MIRSFYEKAPYLARKISYSVWALCACTVLLASSLAYTVMFSALEAPPYLSKMFVLSDIKEGNCDELPSKIDEDDMDAAWASVTMPQDFDVYIGEYALTAENAVRNGKMYIGIADVVRSFVPNAGISESAHYVSASADGLSLSASPADNWIVVNGRYLPCDYINGESGALMIPLPVVSKIFVSSLEVSEDTSRAVFSPSEGFIKSGEEYYGESRLYWLSHIIAAESRGESIYGKIAVGNVVMNRVATEGFPGTVYDVIFDTSCGVQFTPAADGSIFNEPDADSVIAAKLCLEGFSVSKSILFFLNPDTATDSWISENRTFVTAIGRHEFYS